MPDLSPDQIQQLVHHYLDGSISPADRQLLEDWYNSGAGDEIEWPEMVSQDVLRETMFARIGERVRETPVRKLKRPLWWAAAAAIVLVAGAGVWLMRDTPTPDLAEGVTHDVQAPATNKAVIISSDGTQVAFDQAARGELRIAGAQKTGSQSLKFTPAGGAVEMRTVSNPRGSQAITIELPDGTLAWLNAASSIRFPSAFSGPERVVMITGETYFEVKHGTQPFKVKAGTETIEDIGTKFNVRAYGDEVSVRTTLVEGAVKTRGRVLKTGEQAIADGGRFQVLADANVEDVTAWKDNNFKYHSVDVNSILSDAARWYNVEIIYRGNIEGTVTGGIERNVNASEFLKILEATGRVRFEIENKKIIVIPMSNQP